MRRFLLVGLTGGVATGKSTVSAMFAYLGAKVIDADQLAREVVMPGQPAHTAIVKDFGEAVLQPDGFLDRKRLGAIVFADANRRKRLEQITHPAIRARQQRILSVYEEEGFEGIVIWDAALLIETGAAALVDRVVVVDAAAGVQLERLMAREGMGEVEARARIAAQMPMADKRRQADHVIDNSESRAGTKRQVREVHRALLDALHALQDRARSPSPSSQDEGRSCPDPLPPGARAE